MGNKQTEVLWEWAYCYGRAASGLLSCIVRQAALAPGTSLSGVTLISGLYATSCRCTLLD